MTDTTSLLKGLSAPDPAARQEARRALEAFVQGCDNPLVECIALVEQVENEREARVLSDILGRAINELHLASLIFLTVDDAGWVSSIARRAIRTWLDNASPVDASEGLQRCLIAAADLNDSRADEFLCTVIVEKVSQEAHFTYRPLVPMMDGIIARRGGVRHNMTWLLGTPAPETHNPYVKTLSKLRDLLPDGDLPLPATNTSSTQNLPRPADEAEEEAAQLPLPAHRTAPEQPLSLWERLFGKRAR